MEPFLQQSNRKIDKALGDGNCLFRALAKQTTGDSENHVQLQNVMMDFVETSPKTFQPLIELLYILQDLLKTR